MAEEYSREAVFEILGQEVPDKEMQRAESYADRKLERATEMQPEDTATYRSGWYRVLLVADLVKQLAFQDFTLALCELRNYEPKGGIQTNANTLGHKKGQTPRTPSPSDREEGDGALA